MPELPVQPLSISLDFFDMNDMNVVGHHHTPLSSASSSCSEPSKPSSLSSQLKRRNSSSSNTSSAKVLSSKRLSNEEKQAKNRLFVKRCYYKKREALKNLREQVAQLESEFDSVLAHWQQQNEHAAEAFRDGKRCITAQDLYAELTTVRGALIQEQQQLNLRLADRHLFRQRLQQLYEPTR
uniref:BZIP domain-containing protein n=1 Tax=Peronospora matthiolae TaxID=2874970 RepID=A0AAV1TM18_9STRA